MPYLLKSEPDKYSYDDLLRDGETVWDGIKNPQALITLRNMKPGEQCIIYHSNVGKAAVGTAKVVSVTTDPNDPKTPIVRLKAGKRLKREKLLAEIRAAGVFQGSIMFRQFRLSVVPLSEDSIGWFTVESLFRSQSSPKLLFLASVH
jgi:predicted RNA-binding protein with PUA-like domain